MQLETRDEQGVWLHFCVQDSGIGMTAEQCSRLFESFSLADSSTTRKYGGTGLGLAISRNLVELMGGRICVESEQGSGSRFHFRVQLSEPVQEVPQRMFRADELAGTRVLLLEAGATAREILASQLRNLQLRVTCCDSAADTLTQLHHAEQDGSPYDLLLASWKPGAEATLTSLEGLAALQLHKAPAVIVITAFGREAFVSVARERRLGYALILNQPLTPSLLLEGVGNVLGKAQLVARRNLDTGQKQLEHRQKLAGARLLLVEDNEMNKELAVELLGAARISLVCAQHGEEALAILAADQDFDCVLMDCQMSVMDGYTATRLIRANPRWSGLPIIAMTANTMAGDKEKVLAAGMNDHIAKPLNVEQMFATLVHWIRPRHTVAGPIAAPQATSADDWADLPGLDVPAGLAVMNGDHALYRKMLRRFAESQEAFAQAHAGGDYGTALRLAHTLKGNAGSIGAQSVQQAAAKLESACQEHADSAIDQCLQALLEVQQPLLASLQELQPLPPTEPQPTLDSALRQELFVRLRQLLEDCDAEAQEVCARLAEGSPDAQWQSRFARVQRLTDDCDFDAALEALQTLL
ncbi:TPA: response regulator [Aeromonas veronii]